MQALNRSLAPHPVHPNLLPFQKSSSVHAMFDFSCGAFASIVL